MNILRHALGGLLAAVLVMATVLGPAATPAQADVCTELLVNGGFEADAGWQLGPSPVMPQYVTYTKHSGIRSLSLGITSGANVVSFSSARQTVAIPTASPQVLLSFWFYAMADSPATTDYMEVVLLDATGAAILNKPWLSHNDSRVWNQLTFDLTPWRGQTVQLYFNVYNDGVGGRAAMFLDDVSLVSCSSITTPTGTVTPTSGPLSPTPTPSPTATPGCVDVVVDGSFDSGLANWQVVGDYAGAASVSAPVRSAPNALKLGSLDQNLTGLTTVRQLVTIPSGYPLVTLEAWVYTQAQAGADADYQEMALLNSSGGMLYRPWQGRQNNPAWQQLMYNVSAFAGQTVFVSFSVNNDGIGGRTAMHVDDVRLRACASGAAATATATGTPAPASTSTPTVPPATLTAVSPGCIEITQNGGFEAGYQPWQFGANLLPAQRVTAPVASGSYAMQMGSQTANRNSYSSVRQVVTAPWGRPRVVVSFWAYTWAEELSGTDCQQFVLLAPGDVVWATPWRVLEDEGAWRQHVFDVVGAVGQPFSLYFNVCNDGEGGRTALFVDEVHAWACTSGAYPTDLELNVALSIPDPELGVALPLPTRTLTPFVAAPGRAPAAVSVSTPEADQTRIALQVPTQFLAGTRVATETPTSVIDSLTGGEASSLATGIRNWLNQLNARLPHGWPLLIALIVALLLFILLRGWLRR